MNHLVLLMDLLIKPQAAIQGGQEVGEDQFCISLTLFANFWSTYYFGQQLRTQQISQVCLSFVCVVLSRCCCRLWSLSSSSDAASWVFHPAGAIEPPLMLH